MLEKANKERLRYLLNRFNTTSVEIERALTFKYGPDKHRDLSMYTDNDIKRAIDYYYEKKFN